MYGIAVGVLVVVLVVVGTGVDIMVMTVGDDCEGAWAGIKPTFGEFPATSCFPNPGALASLEFLYA